MLQQLCANGDVQLIKAFCAPSSNMQKAIFPAFSTEQLLLKNAHNFPGARIPPPRAPTHPPIRPNPV
jgi:hypothetical protein